MVSDRVGSTHPAAVALAGALVHAEDADILTLSVEANLQQRERSHAGEDRDNWFHDTTSYFWSSKFTSISQKHLVI